MTKNELKKYQSWDIEAEVMDKPEDAVFEKIFGAGNRQAKDWRPYFPNFENQWGSVYCLLYSFFNAYEGWQVSQGLDKDLANWSERWLAAHIDFVVNGTTFAKVGDAARNYKLVLDKDCPFEEKWLKNTSYYRRQINDVSCVTSDTSRFEAPNYSTVSTSLTGLKNALADTPLWCGVGISDNWENEVVKKPLSYRYYHGITLLYVDNKYKYIGDSLGRPIKRLALNYPILYAKSLKDLPEDWRVLQKKVMTRAEVETLYWHLCLEKWNDGLQDFVGRERKFVEEEMLKSIRRQYVEQAMAAIDKRPEILRDIKK